MHRHWMRGSTTTRPAPARNDPRGNAQDRPADVQRSLIASRIEQACRQNVLFMAVSGDSQPSYTHISKFVRELGEQIPPVFTQVLLTCERQGLIGRQMFAIDGVMLPSNASKERSRTHAELRHRAEPLDKAARKMIELHRSRDDGVDASRRCKRKHRPRATSWRASSSGATARARS